VRVHKRVETREEVVNTPTFREAVRVVHVPMNMYIDDVVPEVREEDGVLVIPIIEEVVVTEKRLFLREEVRIRKERAERTDTQTVTLRREVVDVEREELAGPGRRERNP
jgi:stress response protein YsnF